MVGYSVLVRSSIVRKFMIIWMLARLRSFRGGYHVLAYLAFSKSRMFTPLIIYFMGTALAVLLLRLGWASSSCMHYAQTM